MTDLRNAGMGWPNGPVSDDILALPSPHLLLLSTERWHYQKATAAGKQVLYRAIVKPEDRPAKIEYDAVEYIDAIVDDLDDIGGKVLAIIPWNELDLNYERGDDADDFADLDDRYRDLGRFCKKVVKRLRSELLEGTEIHFGAWTPDHRALEFLNFWREAADLCDVVDFHAYRSVAEIKAQYEAYRAAFPGKRLALTEWHCYGDIGEERAVLDYLSDAMAKDDLFEAAYFFIWRWDNPSDWWRTSFDVEHDHGRRLLFMDPTAVPEPTEEDRMRKLARAAAGEAGIDQDLFEEQIKQESNFDPKAYNVGSGASGIAQIVPFWHPKKLGWDPETDVWLPEKALPYAARLMADHLRYYSGDWALALSAYNAGRGATERGRAGELDGWPYAETVTYVSNILGLPTGEAKRRLTGSAAPTADLLYGPDVPDEITRQRDDWSCSVRSTASALWAMHAVGHGPPITYDDVYNRLVPGVADPAVGLKLGSGVDLAAALRAMGYEASNRTSVSLADVQALAGKQPVLIGGHGWGPAGHWAYVRGVEPDGTLILENPAGTYQGISDRLRDSWERLGPWSMVKIDVTDRPNHAEMAKIEELQARVAALEANVAALEAGLAAATAERDAALTARNSLVEGLAVAADDHGDAIQQALDAIRQIRSERVGPRP